MQIERDLVLILGTRIDPQTRRQRDVTKSWPVVLISGTAETKSRWVASCFTLALLCHAYKTRVLGRRHHHVVELHQQGLLAFSLADLVQEPRALPEPLSLARKSALSDSLGAKNGCEWYQKLAICWSPF